MTTSRWAWKQPSFKESVIAHWSSPPAPKMKRDTSNPPRPRPRMGGSIDSSHPGGSGTFCSPQKASLETVLEGSEARMLA